MYESSPGGPEVDWAVATLHQDGSVGDGRYHYPSYPSAPAASVGEVVGECPADPNSRTVNQYGVDFIEIDCRGDFRLTFEGQGEIPEIPADAYSGEYAFWSNRCDESDMTLTRTFDFTDVTAPITLDYKLWYEIEDGWDFVYLVASTDGGETWEMVRTPSGTDKDPFGNSYGWGYTGNSGGGDTGEWIQESVDLSKYAGEDVLLRFEYVTDQAVNGEGLMVDTGTGTSAGPNRIPHRTLSNPWMFPCSRRRSSNLSWGSRIHGAIHASSTSGEPGRSPISRPW